MKVSVVITARPSYSRVKTVIDGLLRRNVEVTVVCAASALLERYGNVSDLIEAEYLGTVKVERIWTTLEGTTRVTSAKETGLLLVSLADLFSRSRPNRVIVIADRHEVLAAAQAASYLHIPLVHLQGGERSGSIDDKVRNAITHLADVHCVSNDAAGYRVHRMTEDCVFVTGCPAIDLASAAISQPRVTSDELGGVGDVDLSGRFVVVMQHPVTSETTQREQMSATLAAVNDLPTRVGIVAFWPGQDAGGDEMSKVLRTWKWNRQHQLVRNIPPTRFLRLLTQASVLIGNSSVGIRECAFMGVPVVNIGSRQDKRERSSNVVDVAHDYEQIRAAVTSQSGRVYPSSVMYGDGKAGDRVADIVAEGMIV